MSSNGEILLDAEAWRDTLGLTPQRIRPTSVRIQILNAVPTMSGGLHRWLHRNDVIRLLYSEAQRLNSRDLELLADRIKEATQET